MIKISLTVMASVLFGAITTSCTPGCGPEDEFENEAQIKFSLHRIDNPEETSVSDLLLNIKSFALTGPKGQKFKVYSKEECWNDPEQSSEACNYNSYSEIDPQTSLASLEEWGIAEGAYVVSESYCSGHYDSTYNTFEEVSKVKIELNAVGEIKWNQAEQVFSGILRKSSFEVRLVSGQSLKEGMTYEVKLYYSLSDLAVDSATAAGQVCSGDDEDAVCIDTNKVFQRVEINQL